MGVVDCANFPNHVWIGSMRPGMAVVRLGRRKTMDDDDALDSVSQADASETVLRSPRRSSSRQAFEAVVVVVVVVAAGSIDVISIGSRVSAIEVSNVATWRPLTTFWLDGRLPFLSSETTAVLYKTPKCRN